MNKVKKDTRWLTSVALMAAVVILLANTPLGMIQLPVIKATTVHIPVILGAVILGPAAPTTAPRLGESLSDPLKMYLGDIYTISANLAGLPGICLPCGKDRKGLPVGLQLLGDCFQEKKILQAAYAYECVRGEFTLAGGVCSTRTETEMERSGRE